MKFSEASGREVVSRATAETLGQVAEFVIDPQSHSIIAVTLKKTQHGDTVLWGVLSAFGVDAVTVPGVEVILDANDAVAALAGKNQRLLGKRVLNTDGEDLGAVADVEFDPATGRLTALLLANGAVRGELLIGIGSYAAIVHADS
ncbi:MAG: PRC-barrel domain-containing protein [Pedococcus sp.]